MVTSQPDIELAKPLLLKYNNDLSKSGVIAEYQYVNDTVNDNVILLMVTEKE
jgi:hypothetical protein